MFVEEVQGARPRKFRGLFVITRRCVVMEAVLFTLVHVDLIDLVVGLKCCLVGGDAFVDPLIITRVLE